MCIEDIRLGRNSKARSYTVATAVTNQQIVPFDANRTALILSSGDTNTAKYTWNPDSGSASGIIIGASNGPMVLDIKQHGALVLGPIFGCTPVGVDTVTYAETVTDAQ